MAGLRTGVVAAGQRQQAGLSAGGAGPGVAAVGLSARVVAGRRTPGEDAAGWRRGYLMRVKHRWRRCEGVVTCRALCSAEVWCSALDHRGRPTRWSHRYI